MAFLSHKNSTKQIFIKPWRHVFNLSLSNGIFPARLKTSRTIPVFKAGRADLCDNYRPIALLSSLSKVLEKMVSVQLINHLDRNKLLYKHQYGFQRNKSTEHSIIHALNFISTAMNENKYTIGVFFDLKKAFDVCSHDILLMKLNKMGITGTAYSWFESYLSERSQIVDINGIKSRSRKIKISVLQGSVLGPILFLCFINDLHSVTSLLTLMYADDTFSLESGDDLLELSTKINTEINKMAIWFRANKLAVNISKTKYMIFRSKGKKINPEPVIIYNENEPNHPHDDSLITVLERYHDNHASSDCRSYKLLGIYLDEHLSLDAHVNHICNKLNRSLYCIRQAKHVIPASGLKSLYFALIHSYLTYCTLIFNGITVQNKNRIEKVQKKAVRIMTETRIMHTLRLYFNSMKFYPLINLYYNLNYHSCMLLNINTHLLLSKILGLKIVTESLQSNLETPTITTCHYHVQRPLKNPPITLSLLPGMNLRLKLNFNKMPSLSSGHLKPTYLNP